MRLARDSSSLRGYGARPKPARAHRRYTRRALAVLTACLVSGFLPVLAQEQPEPAVGTLAGHVSIPEDAVLSAPAQAVLLSPPWNAIWNGEVQQRIDNYFSRSLAEVARDPSLFERIRSMARRDAVLSVLSQMQGRLGLGFSEMVREVPADGRFEFAGVPFGDHTILVVARSAGTAMIWVAAVTVRSAIPEFIEVEDRVQ